MEPTGVGVLTIRKASFRGLSMNRKERDRKKEGKKERKKEKEGPNRRTICHIEVSSPAGAIFNKNTSEPSVNTPNISAKALPQLKFLRHTPDIPVVRVPQQGMV